MERLIRLRPRLQMTAELVQAGTIAADIGTDHAYLPVYLVQAKACPRVYACDVRPGPLENARQTIRAYGLEGRIETILSDGLDALEPEQAETVILAGMGGTLIARLLARAAWLLRENQRIVLQPMSHAEDARSFLLAHGFVIEREDAVRDEGRCYLALSARYTGVISPHRPMDAYLGRLMDCDKPEAFELLLRQARHLQTRLEALRRARRNEEEQRLLEAVLDGWKKEGMAP